MTRQWYVPCQRSFPDEVQEHRPQTADCSLSSTQGERETPQTAIVCEPVDDGAT